VVSKLDLARAAVASAWRRVLSRVMRWLASWASAARSWDLALAAAETTSGLAQLQDEGARLNRRARADDDLVDAALGAGGDPADFLGDEGAEAADLADHRAALDGVDPHEVALDRGGGGLELGQPDGDADQDDAGDGGVDDAFAAFFLGGVGAGDVHAVVSCRPQLQRPCQPMRGAVSC
jgi:hypothetical protein